MGDEDHTRAFGPFLLPANETAPSAARDWLAHFEERDWVQDLGLVVSELVTNVIRHTSSQEAAIALVRRDDVLRVEVTDGDRTRPVVNTGPAGVQAGGLGLRIVDTMADRWGVDVRDDGKTVWAEFDRP
ncbi:ATP-binding protein [Dermatobacter hominis]|uniref:ATP-binding protein n=1 Tax=Dermatobacter hominis TaxID=2884263 RepID=UPI001D128891|nr:ATP-binding protein [Dermatobacter hominis]UDY37637.1 ATP-binding protein [Dermatobacter hominis]